MVLPIPCAPMNGIQQLAHSLPQSSPQKSASGKSQLHSGKARPIPKNFMTIGGCFECYTYRVMVLGWLKKEERKKERNKEEDD